MLFPQRCPNFTAINRGAVIRNDEPPHSYRWNTPIERTLSEVCQADAHPQAPRCPPLNGARGHLVDRFYLTTIMLLWGAAVDVSGRVRSTSKTGQHCRFPCGDSVSSGPGWTAARTLLSNHLLVTNLFVGSQRTIKHEANRWRNSEAQAVGAFPHSALLHTTYLYIYGTAVTV